MRFFLLIALLCSLSFSDILELKSFKAEFTQTITDEKGEMLTYSGEVQALKPQCALWEYKKPVEKRVYIQNRLVSIVEPELEQVIIRRISSDFNLFKLIQSAKKIDENSYLAKLDETEILIKFTNAKLTSLAYKDKFDNDVKVVFSNQHQNISISTDIFTAVYPSHYDIIAE